MQVCTCVIKYYISQKGNISILTLECVDLEAIIPIHNYMSMLKAPSIGSC